MDNAKLYTSDLPTHLKADDWTLFDKVTYGGLGYGTFSLPSNFFVVILTCLFPPLGQIINTLGTTISPDPPFLTWESLKIIFEGSNFNKIIYSFLFTCLFYIPGLVYVLGNIVDSENASTTPTTSN